MIYENKIKLRDTINKIKDKAILKEIFLLVHNELTSSGDNKYSYNNNGILFDLNILSDQLLYKVEEIINVSKDTIMDSSECTDNKPTFNVYSQDDNVEYMKITNGFKLSNKEKNLFNNYMVNK